MTQSTDPTLDDTNAEPLWMVCRKGGDVLVRWENLTQAEQQDAHRHHDKLYGYGVET